MGELADRKHEQTLLQEFLPELLNATDSMTEATLFMASVARSLSCFSCASTLVMILSRSASQSSCACLTGDPSVAGRSTPRGPPWGAPAARHS